MGAPAMSPRRTLLLLCLASAGWAFSFGLGAPLASLWLADAGCPSGLIGLNTSTYYLGIALAAVVVPRLMRCSSRTCVLAGMALDGLTTALFPWCGGHAGWFALRLLGGAGSALSLIPMETLVNHNAPPDRRARDFGFYAFSVALGVGLGSICGLPLYPIAPRLAFALGGLVTLLAALLLRWEIPWERTQTCNADGDGPFALRGQLLSLGTAWAQGFLEGGMLTFLSIYLMLLGYSEAGTGSLLGGLFLGVVLFQVPVAWLADRLGRRAVLLACHAVLLAGLCGLPFCTGPLALGAWLFALGGCCGALYPLGLALLGEGVPAAALARANAWYLACNCAGSLSGPVLMGLAIDCFGRSAQFAVGGAAVVLAVGNGLLWSRRRAAGQPTETGQGSSDAAGRRARMAG
jgi:MFS family permease